MPVTYTQGRHGCPIIVVHCDPIYSTSVSDIKHSGGTAAGTWAPSAKVKGNVLFKEDVCFARCESM